MLPSLSDRVWTSSELAALRGSTEPRIFTAPLCELGPQTSEGYDVIEFARLIGRPLDPWQAWLVIHAMELLPDGRPRFRQVLVLVARQNGKTELCVILSLYWLFLVRVSMVLGTSTKLDYAKISWDKACSLAKRVEFLSEDLPDNRNRGIRQANGEQELSTKHGSTYKIAASNGQGGRSLTVDRLIEDELREHKDWSAHNAAENAMNAVPDGQAWAISNQGPEDAVVLESFRNAALEFINEGAGDHRLGLFEWSAPDGAEVDDPLALAAANPSLNHRIMFDNIVGKARRAKAAGGEEEMTFKIEVLCQRVRLLDPAIDPASWARAKDPGTLDTVRRRLALCIDVSPDSSHVTAAVAGVLADGRTRVELVGDWSGADATTVAARALPALIARVRPRTLGWFPAGPGAELAADLSQKWPAGVTVEEIRGDTRAVCMGFAGMVRGGVVAHSGDPLLDSHVEYAERLHTGDAWQYSRKGEGHVDAVYAAAGAAFLARTLPAPVGKPRILTGKAT